MFEIFLASLLPDSASGALVTKGHIFCSLQTLMPFASYMKSNRQNQQIKLWNSHFALLCPAKFGGNSIRKRSHRNLLCCVWPTVGIYMRSPNSREQCLQLHRLTIQGTIHVESRGPNFNSSTPLPSSYVKSRRHFLQ